MFSAYGLGIAANVVLAAFLLGLAFTVARRSGAPGHGALAVFLALVGANYGLAVIGSRLGARLLSHAALVAVLLDPAALLAFTLATTGRPLRGARLALVAAPAVALAVLYVAFPPGAVRLTDWSFSAGYVVELGGFYAL